MDADHSPFASAPAPAPAPAPTPAAPAPAPALTFQTHHDDDEKHFTSVSLSALPGQYDEADIADHLHHHPAPHGQPLVEPRRSVEERLGPTLAVAKIEQAKYAQRAKLAGLAVNGSMFAQVVINALVTGLAAAQNSRQAQIGVSALGAVGTIIASFLVRVRGTREPERSVTHSQNLEKYIRELEAFILDEGYSIDRKWDSTVKAFREEFDNLQTAAHQSENGQPMSQKPPLNPGDAKLPV